MSKVFANCKILCNVRRKRSPGPWGLLSIDKHQRGQPALCEANQRPTGLYASLCDWHISTCMACMRTFVFLRPKALGDAAMKVCIEREEDMRFQDNLKSYIYAYIFIYIYIYVFIYLYIS